MAIIAAFKLQEAHLDVRNKIAQRGSAAHADNNGVSTPADEDLGIQRALPKELHLVQPKHSHALLRRIPALCKTPDLQVYKLKLSGQAGFTH